VGEQEQRVLESKEDRKGNQKAPPEASDSDSLPTAWEAAMVADGPTAREDDNKRKSGGDDMAQEYRTKKRERDMNCSRRSEVAYDVEKCMKERAEEKGNMEHGKSFYKSQHRGGRNIFSYNFQPEVSAAPID
jgi:hypothetical protein